MIGDGGGVERRAPAWQQPAAKNSPAKDDGLSRFLGGPPHSVVMKLVLLSVLVGVILSVMGFDPWNIIESVQRLFHAIWDMGFDAVRWVWRYFLLGAVLVVPIWLVVRLGRGMGGRG
jgi:Family of unknown function (DUF6460)